MAHNVEEDGVKVAHVPVCVEHGLLVVVYSVEFWAQDGHKRRRDEEEKRKDDSVDYERQRQAPCDVRATYSVAKSKEGTWRARGQGLEGTRA